MKNLMRFKIQILALIFAVCSITACQKDNVFADDKAPPKTIAFDMDTFEDNVENGLGTEWAGYAFIINQNGKGERFGTFGNRVAGNDGNVPHNVSAPMYAASINKTITALAMLKSLENIGTGDVSSMLNANVYQFLPSHWQFGPNTTNISFKNLLQHRSGIPEGTALDYTSLRAMFAVGTSSDKSYNYENANYALLRVLIALINGSFNDSSIGDDNYMSNATNQAFDRYMRTEIFDPLDIDVDTKPFGNNPALYYTFDNLNNGWTIGDLSDRLGNGGYYIAPINIAKLLAFVNHTEDIITSQMREEMYDKFLGWSDGNPDNIADGDHGTYYYKGGSFCNIQNGNCRGVRNIIATFPESKVEVVIMANSRGGTMDSTNGIRNMLKNSYDNAWILK